jgi:type II secretory pathway pseudopilin PulG
MRPVVVVVALFGLLFGFIIVPNMYTALQRSRQKQTMADLRTIATAWEARATDTNSYDVDHGYSAAKDGGDFNALHRVRSGDLRRALEPTYVKQFPQRDGWGGEYEFATGGYDQKGAAQIYTIRSLGSDHLAERGPYVNRPNTDYKQDIVYTNGEFLLYPEGT